MTTDLSEWFSISISKTVSDQKHTDPGIHDAEFHGHAGPFDERASQDRAETVHFTKSRYLPARLQELFRQAKPCMELVHVCGEVNGATQGIKGFNFRY